MGQGRITTAGLMEYLYKYIHTTVMLKRELALMSWYLPTHKRS